MRSAERNGLFLCDWLRCRGSLPLFRLQNPMLLPTKSSKRGFRRQIGRFLPTNFAAMPSRRRIRGVLPTNPAAGQVVGPATNEILSNGANGVPSQGGMVPLVEKGE